MDEDYVKRAVKYFKNLDQPNIFAFLISSTFFLG